MQDLGKFKGCAYTKFDYDPYKTDWVYITWWVEQFEKSPEKTHFGLREG